MRNRAAGLRHVLAPQNSTIPLSAGCFRAVADNRFFIPPVAWPCPVICWANIASHEFTRPQPAMTGVCPRAKAGHGPTMALPARFIKRGDGKSSMPARLSAIFRGDILEAHNKGMLNAGNAYLRLIAPARSREQPRRPAAWARSCLPIQLGHSAASWARAIDSAAISAAERAGTARRVSTDRRADCRFIRQSGELFVLFGVFNRRALSRAVVVLSAKARRCAACREW